MLHGIPLRVQYGQSIEYKGLRIKCGYRIDLLVDNTLIVELKNVERLVGIHEAQLITYMKLSGMKTGLLLNFNVKRSKDGIRRFVP